MSSDALTVFLRWRWSSSWIRDLWDIARHSREGHINGEDV